MVGTLLCESLRSLTVLQCPVYLEETWTTKVLVLFTWTCMHGRASSAGPLVDWQAHF